VLDSQKAFAQRAGQWQNDYMVDFKMAWNHYFRAGQEGLTDRQTPAGPRRTAACKAGGPVLFCCTQRIRKTAACKNCCCWWTALSTWLGQLFAWLIVR
jgi:hypothetical protein